MIRGFFRPDSKWPVPMVRASIWLPGIQRQWARVDFLLDTCAAYTSLHPTAAIARAGVPLERLNDPSQWGRRETYTGIGGAAEYYIVEAQYLFLKEGASEYRLEAEIRIARPMPGNDRLPSILGWDILERFEIAAHWATRTITLS